MVRRALLTIALLGLGSGGATAGDLISACEQSLADHLVAPAGYHRVSATQTQKTVSRDDYHRMLIAKIDYSYEKTEQGLREYDAGKVPEEFSVHLVYDAPNAFNAPVRGVVDCVYVAFDGDVSGANGANVRLIFP
ncbi:hypothetical protein SAMN03159406_00537 [Rhizobium sp. NFR03]|nr:hypothetical protein SAMN03159406_00537 [Rhizobium sp. NFR03]